MKKTILIAIAVSSLFSSDSLPVLKHECSRPLKPLKFTEQRDVERYNSSVQGYQECMFRFIEDNKAIIAEHSQAVNSTIAEWNEFASGTKEKKEDSGIYGDKVQRNNSTVGHSDPKALFKDFKF